MTMIKPRRTKTPAQAAASGITAALIAEAGGPASPPPTDEIRSRTKAWLDIAVPRLAAMVRSTDALRQEIERARAIMEATQ
jgi:hypothetical protein